MGSHLSKLKESKLKKLVHLGINKEEEKEEWDEREKANYEGINNLRSLPWKS